MGRRIFHIQIQGFNALQNDYLSIQLFFVSTQSQCLFVYMDEVVFYICVIYNGAHSMIGSCRVHRQSSECVNLYNNWILSDQVVYYKYIIVIMWLLYRGVFSLIHCGSVGVSMNVIDIYIKIYIVLEYFYAKQNWDWMGFLVERHSWESI